MNRLIFRAFFLSGSAVCCHMVAIGASFWPRIAQVQRAFSRADDT